MGINLSKNSTGEIENLTGTYGKPDLNIATISQHISIEEVGEDELMLSDLFR